MINFYKKTPNYKAKLKKGRRMSMRQRSKLIFSTAVCLIFLLSLFPANVQAAITLTSNATGNHDGYDYEYWKDYGNGTMTLTGGGTFTCSWSNINNILFRTGKKLGSTQTYQQYGNITIDYACNYQPNGNSYLSVYGWTQNPLVEYYIIESYGTWKPPGSNSPKGYITVDGGTYEIYETTRYNQPSIEGDKTFQQYWSVRTVKRTSGTISVHEHFRAWESKGMRMGKLYEVSMVVEGYQSSGRAEMTKMNINIGGQGSGNTGGNNGNPGSPVTEQSAFTTLEAEKYNSTNSSTAKVIGTANGGSGMGYIENGDYLTFNKVNFGSGATSFKARVAYGGDSSTTIELRLGGPTGTLIGSLKVASTGGWDSYKELSTTVSGASDVKDLYLCFNGPVNIDSFVFGGNTGTDGNTGGNSGNTGNNGNTGNTGSGPVIIQCENMTKSGQYTGNISNPFSGVALYANNDSVKFTHNFTSATSSFALRGCSNNQNMARVDLRIDGQYKGTFYYGGSYPAVYTIKNVSHGTGNHTVELIVTADNGTWDAFLDYLQIE